MQISKNSIIKIFFVLINILFFSSFITFGRNYIFGIHIYKILDSLHAISLCIIMCIILIIFLKNLKITYKNIIYFIILNLLLIGKYVLEFKVSFYIKDLIIYNSILMILFTLKINKFNFKDIEKNIDILNIFPLFIIPLYFIMSSDYFLSLTYLLNFPNYYQEYVYYNFPFPNITLSNSLNWIMFAYFILNFTCYLNTKKIKYYYYIFIIVFFIFLSRNLYIKIIFILFNVSILLYYFDFFKKINIYFFKYSFLILFLLSCSFLLIPYEKVYMKSNVYKTLESKTNSHKFNISDSLITKKLSESDYEASKFNKFECQYLKICFNNINNNFFAAKSIIERLEMQRIIKKEFLKNKKNIFIGNFNLSNYQVKNKVFTHNSYVNLILGQGLLISILFIFVFQNLIKNLDFKNIFQYHILTFLFFLPMLDDYLFRNRIEVTITYWLFITIFAKKDFLYET